MRVNVFSYSDDGAETFETQCEHTECFPDDPAAAYEALEELEEHGRYVTGGGAAPLFVLQCAEFNIPEHWKRKPAQTIGLFVDEESYSIGAGLSVPVSLVPKLFAIMKAHGATQETLNDSEFIRHVLINRP